MVNSVPLDCKVALNLFERRTHDVWKDTPLLITNIFIFFQDLQGYKCDDIVSDKGKNDNNSATSSRQRNCSN